MSNEKEQRDAVEEKPPGNIRDGEKAQPAHREAGKLDPIQPVEAPVEK